MSDTKLTAGTGGSITIDRCQCCGNTDLKPFLFLGYIPPVNQMPEIGEPPVEKPAYPAEVVYCDHCKLVQLSCIVDQKILFAADYPYTSGTTGILHKNFMDMVADCEAHVLVPSDRDLVVDIGSNDGTLLSKWKDAGYKVHGIEPTDKALLANANGVPTTQAYFAKEAVDHVIENHGHAKVLTATNVFAHIENVHSVVEQAIRLLDDKGVFINESHYLLDLMNTLQYDTVYHEHLRYYSLLSQKWLLEKHGLELVRVKRIPTHGGSIRVYAARPGVFKPDGSVQSLLEEERQAGLDQFETYQNYAQAVLGTKLALYELLAKLKSENKRIVGIGAPSRASTLVNYMALDEQCIEAVLEIKGSYKIGHYMPGTRIPVIEEAVLFTDPQPDVALFLSWHIAEELAPKLRAKGFKGQFAVPLPKPCILNV